MNKLRSCLIGAGSMGYNHARTISKSGHSDLALVIDSDLRKAENLANLFDSKYQKEIENLKNIDYAIVATSTESHYAVITKLLSLDIPFLVEKPICHSLQDLNSLHQAIIASKQFMMCGFVERFNPVFLALQEITVNPQALYATRHSPSVSRITSDIAGDLLIHDLDLAIRIFGSAPTQGFSNSYKVKVNESIEIRDAMDVLLSFSNNRTANLSVSRVSQKKTRRIEVIDADRLIEVDMLRRTLSVFHNIQEQISADGIGYKQHTVVEIPSISHNRDPLAAQLDFFVNSVKENNGECLSRLVDDAFLPHWEMFKLSS